MDDPGALVEERPLVEPVAAHDVMEAGGVGERDRDDPVPGAGGARELVAFGCHHLDVESEAAEIREHEPAEGCPPGLKEVLVDGVAEEEVGCPRRVRGLAGSIPAAVTRAEGVAPGPEARPPAQVAGARERFDGDEAPGVRDEVAVREKDER